MIKTGSLPEGSEEKKKLKIHASFMCVYAQRKYTARFEIALAFNEFVRNDQNDNRHLFYGTNVIKPTE